MPERCTTPPPGWWCSRENGHDGPCAARPEVKDRWWHTLMTFVPREAYLRATRALHDARAAYHDERARSIEADTVMRHQREYIAELETDRARRAGEMAGVRVALGRVSQYDGGIAESNPVALLVDGLVRDHEALEERIERVLDLVLVRRDMDKIDQSGDEFATLNQIVGLLQGQITNAPNTVEGLDE